MKQIIIGDCTLYSGNAFDILPKLDTVDVIITDPPYDKFTQRGAVTHQSKGDFNVGLSFEHFESLDFVAPTIQLARTWSIFFCSLEMLGKYQAQAEDLYVRSAVWDRITNTPYLKGDRPGQGAEGIAIFHSTKKNMIWNGGGKAGIFRHIVERGQKEHPTQKPLSLMIELLQLFTNRGDLVLDPFMGAGTTGVACAQMGRRFVGIELNPDYFKMAKNRIENVYRRSLFLDSPDRFKPARLG